MILLYWWLVSRQAASFIRRFDIARISVVLFFLLILLLISLISFFSGIYFYRYIFSFDEFSPVLIKFILTVLMWALFVLSCISFIIAFIQNFSKREISLLMVSHRSPLSIITALFINTVVAGSWPYIIISFPFFTGQLMQRASTTTDMAILFLSIGLLSILTAAIGGISILLFFYVCGKHAWKILPAVLCIGLILLFYLFTTIIYPKNLSEIVEYSTQEEVSSSLQQLPITGPYYPPVLFVESMLGDRKAIVFLFGQTILIVSLFFLLTKKSFRRIWQIQYEGRAESSPKLFIFQSNIFRFYSIFPRSFFSTFVQKEILSFTRMQGSYMYMGFILFLIAIFVYFVNLSAQLKYDYKRLAPFLVVAIIFSVAYIFLLIAMKYIFPAFIQESSYLWSFITRVRARTLLVSSKWIFYLFVSSVIILILSFMTLNSFLVNYIYPFDMVILFGSCAFAITSVSLYAGLVFLKQLPKSAFAHDISTTPAGIIVTVISIGIGVILSWAVVTQKIQYGSSVWIVFIVMAISIILFMFCLRNFKRSDL